MATHEPEITDPVDLCTPDGRRLNPAAKGWSRTPLQRGNLRGSWGRNKRWEYWGVLLGDGFVSLTFADLDYLGMVATEWGDFTTGAKGRAAHISPLGRALDLPDMSGDKSLDLHAKLLNASITESDGTTRLQADWPRRGGRDRFDITVQRPADHESINVVVPWSETRFQFTSKHQALPATGTASLGGVERTIGVDSPAWATLDVGRGRWPYKALWNWAGGAGHTTDGHVIGLQLGSKWTDGTGATENGIILDGVATKIGEELAWDYRIDRPLDPWRVRSADGALDLTLTPLADKPSKLNLGVFFTGGNQIFGSWSGTVPTDDGTVHTLGDDVVGFAEEVGWRW